MQVVFKRRNYLPDLRIPDADYLPQRYSRAAIGGPKRAEIRVLSDNDLALWGFLDKLRAPVEIWSDLGEPLWWGILTQVKIVAKNPFAPEDRRVSAGISIESMYNRTKVAYAEPKEPPATGKTRKTTDHADDLVSQGEYGIRELALSRDDASQALAEAARDTKLAELRYPQLTMDTAEAASESSATLTCSGLWDTLGWLYYANASTTQVDTAAIAYDILVMKGQFFHSVVQELAESGKLNTILRSGDGSALFEVTQLLESGTSNYRRMLASVDPGRVCRLFEEPAPGTRPYLVHADGSMSGPYGQPLRNELCPAGVWARWADAVPPSVDTSALASPSQFFVEENEYDVVNDRLRQTQRGQRSPFDFPKLKDG
jgi:hypothetical protein